jgi:UDP-N-acetylglucosamine 2-epimerase (non-hydrolysing)
MPTGSSVWTELDAAAPAALPVTLCRDIIARAMDTARAKRSWVLAFVVGTKPCFNKVYGAVQACRRRGLPLFVIDANQHYDSVLTFGLEEFRFQEHVGVNLQLRGDLVQKSGELFFKTAQFARWLKHNWPDVTVVPVVNGDTILCPIFPAAWMFARREKSIQNEAGLRSMAPRVFQDMPGDIALEDFVHGQWHGAWQLLRNEPFPEQWDTYVAAAGCEHHMAPVPLNREHLLREGYAEDHIHVIGGVVVDALAWKRRERPAESIFNLYPELANGAWLRLDIHRKENLGRTRFTAIFGAMEHLVQRGHQVNLVLMNATKHAIERWGLSPRLEALTRQRGFLATDVWPAYGHVVEFYDSNHCLAAWTDSGGVQEDMNILGRPCLTIRFSTDRPETVMGNRGNLLLPPISAEVLGRLAAELIESPQQLERLRGAPAVYGSDAGEKFAAAIAPEAEANARALRWSPNLLGLDRTSQDDEAGAF